MTQPTNPNDWENIPPTSGAPHQQPSNPATWPGNRNQPTPGNTIITNPPSPGQQPSTWVPDVPIPGLPGSLIPGNPAAGTNAIAAGYAPGTDIYDWHTVNAALSAAGLNNWQIAGTSHTPVNQGRWVKNPAYDEDDPQPGVEPYTLQEGGEWVIGVINPATGQMLKVTLARAKQPDGGYTWAVIGRQDQGKVDSTNPGHKDIQRLPFQDGHTELWGTNTQSGAFEKLPTQPSGMGEPPPGWSSIRQIEQPDGSLVWMGVPPIGSPQYDASNPGVLVAVPGLPTVRGSGKYDNIRQVTENGRVVYKGRNKQTDTFEVIPELGSEAAPIQTTTVGGKTYKQNPNAGQPGQPDFVQVTGIAQPTEGMEQWIDAGGGYVRKQTYTNGVWTASIDPADYRPISPEAVRAAGAIKPKGTRYEELINGYLVTVEADGNGGYTIPTDAKGRRIPGTEGLPTTIATSTEQEFITQRNPVTGKVEQIRNPSWQPVDVGDRTRQLQQLATQKQKELHDRIGQNGYTAQQADADFVAYWDSEIEPRRQQLQFDQEQQRLKAQNTQETQRANILSTARSVGQEAVANYKAMQPFMVGPGFAEQARNIGESIRGGHMPTIDPAAYTYQMPDLNALSEYHTARALQHISPTAAGLLGGQTTFPTQAQGVDLNALVNRTQFMPSNQPVVINIGGTGGTGGAPAAAPAAPAAPVVAAPAPALDNLTPFQRGPLVG